MDKLDKAASIKTKITDDNNLVDKKVRPSEPPPPTKPNIKTKILVRLQKIQKFFRTKRGMVLILIILIGLGVGGFFIYRNISTFEKFEAPSATKERLETPEVAVKSGFGYLPRGGWNIDLRHLAKERSKWNPIGVMWERAMPGLALWQQIEPKKGQYRWGKIDEYVRGAQERNIKILFNVEPYTDWDQETCNMHLKWISGEGGKDPRDSLSEAHRKGKPCDMEAYKEFLRRLVERYDGDGIEDISGLRYPVTHWEIANEVDCHGYFQGSEEDYFDMLKTSYTTVKETDPNAKVLISALPSIGRESEFEFGRPDFDPAKLFGLGAANYFDIMNRHDYDVPSEVREFLKRYDAGDKPIWETEPTGLRHYQEGVEIDDLSIEAQEELALVLVQVFEESSEHGMTMFFLGGGPISVFRKAINYRETGEFGPSAGEERVEKRVIGGRCDCNALYDFYNTGPDMQEYAEVIREDCNNACGFTDDINKGRCYASLASDIRYDENGAWAGDCLCRNMLAGDARDWCYEHSTMIHRRNACDKIQDPAIKEGCMSDWNKRKM